MGDWTTVVWLVITTGSGSTAFVADWWLLHGKGNISRWFAAVGMLCGVIAGIASFVVAQRLGMPILGFVSALFFGCLALVVVSNWYLFGLNDRRFREDRNKSA